MDFAQKLVIETIGPVAKVLSGVSTLFEDAVKEYVWLRRARQENEEYRGRIAELEQKLTDYQEAYVENLRLRRLVDFKNTIQAETIAAQVVLYDLTGWFQTLVVDKGVSDKVSPDLPVVNDEGVVGRILDVSDHYSRVLLITDPGSSVDAVVQRNRVRGILSGKDANGCVLRYVRGNLDVQVGDLIITSGKDGVYPKGLRLGVVQGIFKDPVDLFQRIEVRPVVRLSILEEVLVLKSAAAMPESLMKD
jgi:rod shape-determining protein MreC